MLRGEVVGRADDVHRPHRREADGRQRRRRDAHAHGPDAALGARACVVADWPDWPRPRSLSAASPWQFRATTTVVIRPRPANPSRNVNGASGRIHAPQFIPAGVLDTAEPPMRFFGRQDLLLIAALTTALVIVFSSSISRALDYAREIERQSGLTLMPALVLLTARSSSINTAATISSRPRRKRRCWRRKKPSIAPKSSSGWSRSARRWDARSTSTAFAWRSASTCRASPAPTSVWVLVQQGSEWQALSGDTRGAEEVLQWGDLAEQLLASGADQTPSTSSEPIARSAFR